MNERRRELRHRRRMEELARYREYYESGTLAPDPPSSLQQGVLTLLGILFIFGLFNIPYLLVVWAIVAAHTGGWGIFPQVIFYLIEFLLLGIASMVAVCANSCH